MLFPYLIILKFDILTDCNWWDLSIPGVWYWHCHIDRHMSWGMSTTFIVLNGDTEETSMRPPPSYLPPCTDASTITLKETTGPADDTDQI